MKNTIKKQSGQVMLIVLLVLAVSLTVGLATSKRTTVDTKISGDEEHLKQAFNTAESGIDYYLSKGEKNYTAPVGEATAKVDTGEINVSAGGILDFNEYSPSGLAASYWLVGHNADGTINFADPNNFTGGDVEICLGVGFTGSVKIDYYQRLLGSYRILRVGYNLGTGSTVANFTTAGPSMGGNCGSGKRSLTVNIPGGMGVTPLLLLVTPLFDGTRISLVLPTAVFPSQGEEISSTGQTANVNRTIKVSNRWVVPQFMIDALRSQDGLMSAP